MATELEAATAAAGFDGVEFDFESMTAEKAAETNSSFDYGYLHSILPTAALSSFLL